MEKHKDKHKFSKKDGGPIDQGVAKKWTERYKEKHPDGIHAYFFGEDIIRTIIEAPGSEGMRIMLGYNDEGDTQMLLIGTRADGSNIWPDELGKDGSSRGTVGEGGVPSPPN